MRVNLFSLPVYLLLSVQGLAEGRTAAEAAANGNQLLAKGSYADAARAFSEAIGEWSRDARELSNSQMPTPRPI